MTDTDRPENDRVAYCQNCGRPLTAAETRNVGAAIYCEPCLEAKVAAANAASTAGSYGFRGASSGVNYNFQGTVPPAQPVIPGVPNPGLAALLGFIPGVGAFYNGQYAKGVVHLVVFAILTTMADRSGIFSFFVAGWIFYQVIEAHHTARARRDGTPLPNPFGLNDIGERMGFGRAWPAASPVGSAVPPPTAGAAGAPPADAYGPPPAWSAPPAQPGYASYVPPVAQWGAPAEGYGTVPPHAEVPLEPVRPASRVPTGAIVLIGLGIVFLIANSGLVHGFPIYRLVPFLLIGVGVWIFVHRMTEMGGRIADDGSAAYRIRLFRAGSGAIWTILVGVLFLLDSFNILSWGRSWPLFIIVAGVMAFLRRAAYTSSVPLHYGYVPPAAPIAHEPIPPSQTAIVPTIPEDRGGN